MGETPTKTCSYKDIHNLFLSFNSSHLSKSYFRACRREQWPTLLMLVTEHIVKPLTKIPRYFSGVLSWLSNTLQLKINFCSSKWYMIELCYTVSSIHSWPAKLCIFYSRLLLFIGTYAENQRKKYCQGYIPSESSCSG